MTKPIKPATLPSLGTRKTFRVTPKMWSHFYREALKHRAWAKKISREPGWDERVSGMTAESARKALRSTPEELAIHSIQYAEMRANLRSDRFGPDYPLDKPTADMWRKLGGHFNLLDSSNRVVARAKSRVAAHRATRKKKHAGSRVVTMNMVVARVPRTQIVVQHVQQGKSTKWVAKVYDANGHQVSGLTDQDREYIARKMEEWNPGVPIYWDEKLVRYPAGVDLTFVQGVASLSSVKGSHNRALNMAGRRTFAEARSDLLQHLRSQGWRVKADLKYPHAVSPDGRMHLYFKPQAVYVGTGGSGMSNTRSMWVDIRDVDGPAFVRAVESWVA